MLAGTLRQLKTIELRHIQLAEDQLARLSAIQEQKDGYFYVPGGRTGSGVHTYTHNQRFKWALLLIVSAATLLIEEVISSGLFS